MIETVLARVGVAVTALQHHASCTAVIRCHYQVNSSYLWLGTTQKRNQHLQAHQHLQVSQIQAVLSLG